MVNAMFTTSHSRYTYVSRPPRTMTAGLFLIPEVSMELDMTKLTKEEARIILNAYNKGGIKLNVNRLKPRIQQDG